MKYFLGGKKSTPDSRDLKKRAATAWVAPETGAVKFRPAIMDQGETSSCTGHAIAYFWQQILASRGHDVGPLSPWFPWYWARLAEGAADRDDGVTSRGIMAALHKYGACPADFWPKGPVSRHPSELACAYGKALRLPEYRGLDTLRDIQYSIAQEDQSVMLGVTVFNDWMSGDAERTGVIQYDPLRPVSGYHEIVAVEYSNASRRFTCANSWGTQHGAAGYLSVPFEFVTREACDAWTAGFTALPDAASVVA